MNARAGYGWATAVVSLALLMGCDPDVVVDGGDGGGGTAGTTTVTTTSTGGGGIGGSTTVTTTTTGGGGSGGSDDPCAPWADESSTASVTVRFRNESGVNIYLPANCGLVRYDLTASNSPDVEFAFDPFCLQTCEDLQTEGIIDCAACPPSSVLLPAGATLDVPWDGTGLRAANMPDACWAYPGSQGSCEQLVAAGADTYRISAMGYASCGNGTCSCDESGVCDGDGTGADAYAQPAELAFPGQSLVEVVFGVCSFPCPS